MCIPNKGSPRGLSGLFNRSVLTAKSIKLCWIRSADTKNIRKHKLTILHYKSFRLGIIVKLNHRCQLKNEPRPGNKVWWAANNPPGRGDSEHWVWKFRLLLSQTLILDSSCGFHLVASLHRNPSLLVLSMLKFLLKFLDSNRELLIASITHISLFLSKSSQPT